MKNLFIMITIIISVIVTFNLVSQHKEQQYVNSYQLTVKETMNMYKDNEDIYVYEYRIKDMYETIALAYAKEHNLSLKDMPKFGGIYEETKYGFYHKPGRYDAKTNTIFLNRRTSGIEQTLNNRYEDEVAYSILSLLADVY